MKEKEKCNASINLNENEITNSMKKMEKLKNFFLIFPSIFGIKILGFLFELAYSIKQ